MKSTVDIICLKGDQILLIRRASTSNAFPDKLAIPGGFVDEDEAVETAALRELKEETGVDAELKEILGVYSKPGRDPRGHTISTVFIADWKKGEPKAADDAKEASWWKIGDVDINELAFDHGQIFTDFLEWRNKRGTYWSGR